MQGEGTVQIVGWPLLQLSRPLVLQHFSGYDMENSDGTWRGAFDAQVGFCAKERTSQRRITRIASIHFFRSPKRTSLSTTGPPSARVSSERMLAPLCAPTML